MATAKKMPSGNYRIRVYDKRLNKVISFTAPTKKEAERQATDYFINQPTVDELTIGQRIDDYIDLKCNVLSPTTIDKYRNVKKNQLSKTFLDVQICALTGVQIQGEINRLSGQYAPKTVINANALISAVMRTYRPEYHYKVTLPKKQTKVKEYPRPEEIVQWYKGTDIELVVMIALWLGFRLSEIRGLTKADFRNGKVTINRVTVDIGTKSVTKETAKTEKSKRPVSVPKEIEAMVKQLPTENITELNHRKIYQRFKRIARKHGYPDLTFHDLRHLNASIMLSLHVPDKYAMERGGWASTSVLKSVYQATLQDDRTKYDKLIDTYFRQVFDPKFDPEPQTPHAKPRKFKLRKL